MILHLHSFASSFIAFFCCVLIRCQSRLLHPPKPQYCKQFAHPIHRLFRSVLSACSLLGVCRRLCLARRLMRSGFDPSTAVWSSRAVLFLVTFFEGSRYVHCSVRPFPIALTKHLKISLRVSVVLSVCKSMQSY